MKHQTHRSAATGAAVIAAATSLAALHPALAQQQDCQPAFNSKSVVDPPQDDLRYGSQLALDRETCVVGARGSAFVMQRGNASWAPPVELIPDQPDLYGFGLGVAIENDWIVVGATAANSSGAACFFRYDQPSNQWHHHSTVFPSNARRDAQVGFAVAISGDNAVIGAPEIIRNGFGQAWTYHFNGSQWVEQQTLQPSDHQSHDHFGGAVAIDGDVLAVASQNKDNTGQTWEDGMGAVYLFRWNDAAQQWQEEAFLTSNDPIEGERDRFGFALDLQDQTLLVGTNPVSYSHNPAGSAYIHRYDGHTWPYEAKLTASDGSGADRFGAAVALDSGLALVGAWGVWSTGDECPFPQICDAGAAYLYKRDGTRWSEQAIFTSHDIAQHDAFGWDVELWRTSALAASFADDDGARDTGAVYGYDFANGDGNCLPPTLRIDTDCPNAKAATITWDATTPGGRVALVYSPSPGTHTVPNAFPCAGTRIDLNPNGLRLALTADSDPNGAGSIHVNIPNPACGGQLQLIDLTNCAISNLATIR
ncbi:MAG: hypothetical protein HND57_04015 [Planctomycetes bacterium]|nr:hypothetical protein [Planctomycetota bacterium]